MGGTEQGCGGTEAWRQDTGTGSRMGAGRDSSRDTGTRISS